MHYHFCEGELSSSSIIVKADKPCDCDEDAEMNDCCKDLSVLYKIKEDQQHKVVSFSNFDLLKIIAIPFVSNNHKITSCFSEYSETLLTHPPPLLHTKVTLLAFVCKWLI